MDQIIKTHQSKRGPKVILSRPDWTTIDVRKLQAEIAEASHELILYVRDVSNKTPTFQSLVVGLEERYAHLQFMEQCVQHLHDAKRDPIIEEVHTWMTRNTTERDHVVWTDRNFYQAHVAYKKSNVRVARDPKTRKLAYTPFTKLNEEEKTALIVQARSFAAYGMFVSKRKLTEIKKIEAELAKLCEQFDANLNASLDLSGYCTTNEAELVGISDKHKAMMQKEALRLGKEGWVIPLKAEFRNVLDMAECRPLREAYKRAYDTIATATGVGGPERDNEPIAQRILRLRERLAKLNGHPSYAHFVATDSHLGTPKVVRKFLHGLVPHVVRQIKRDRTRMVQFAKSKFGYQKLEPWDKSFIFERFLTNEFGYSRSDIGKFITRERTLAVLFRLIREQYGCRIEESADPRGWTPHIRYFEIFDHTGDLLGGFYLDLLSDDSTEEKSSQIYWMMAFKTRRKNLSGAIEAPLAVIQFRGQAELFTHEEATLLFHEFGHLLEVMFSKANFVVTGYSEREGDVEEVPSIFMENWAWDIDVIDALISPALPRREKRDKLNILLALHKQRPIWEFRRVIDFLEEALIDLEVHSRPVRKSTLRDAVSCVDEMLGVTKDSYTTTRPRISSIESFISGTYPGCSYAYVWSWKIAAAMRMVHLRGPHSRDPMQSRRFRREYIEGSTTRTANKNLASFFRARLPSSKDVLEHIRMV